MGEAATPAQSIAPSKSEGVHGPQLTKELGCDSNRNLFEVIGPALAARTKTIADEYGIAYRRLAPLRLWRAYYVINDAFRSRNGMTEPGVNPQEVLTQMAVGAGKPIYSEFANQEDLVRWNAELSDEAQREHCNIAWAERIDRWLTKGGVYFICMGMNHMLGPDSIPRKLAMRKDGLRQV
jgi:uncharacterized protein YbaP (TraB family)